MRRSTLLTTLALATIGLSGCLGGAGEDDFDFWPGADYTETGNTVHLKSTVVDWVNHQVYPGFVANLWAFCFEPADPSDTYSANAIEYWPGVDTDGAPGNGFEQFDGTCSVPGPTIRVQQGDRVIVDFSHNHFHAHTIHWHGQYTPWKHDGAPGVNQDSVQPGESFTYEFIAKRAGSLWYHCHVDTHFHVMQGLYGVFIVEPQDTTYEPEVDEEYIMVYSTLSRDLVQVTPERLADPHKDHRHKEGECGASGVQNCQNPPVDVSPDTWMLNGRSLPFSTQDDASVVRLDEGDTVRLRLFNMGESLETIHTHGHDMLVTHRDGNPLHPDARFWVDTLSIGPAERYDVLIFGENPGLWMMHTHVDRHVSNSAMAPGGGMSMIVYRDVEAEMGTLRPFAAELPGGLAYTLPLVIPGDVYRTTGTVDVGEGSVPVAEDNVDEMLPFEVGLPCAARSIEVVVDWDPNTAFAQLQNTLEGLRLDVRDGDGDVLEGSSIALEAGRNVVTLRDVAAVPTYTPGLFEAHVTGAAAPGEVKIDAIVDYFETEQKVFFEDANRVVVGTECDPVTRVFDPLNP